jgi:hypothetical protein
MMKVFISHSQEDDALARRIADVLKKAGLDVWDDREIFPGDNWAAKVAKALDESNAMVVLLTANGIASRSVRQDISYALGEKRFKQRLIPVVVGSAEKKSSENFPWILKYLKTIRLAESNNNDEEDLKQIAHVLLENSQDKATVRN